MKENFMHSDKHHICICICTYKRPDLLERLLTELQLQKTDQLFTYSVLVVDNDYNQSAQDTVLSFKGRSIISIGYYIEPQQNIALARNKAIEYSQSDFVAFIDDDEFPDYEWLLNLYKSYCRFNADGVLGPVKPHFETEPPRWIIEGKLCERKTFETGYVLRNYSDTRTGNVLLNKKIFDKEASPFNPDFGRTGGEDTDFFRRMMEKGYLFVWCNEAFVYENVPLNRLKRGYFLKRALLRGVVNSKHISLISFNSLKSVIAFVFYTLALPFFLLIGQHLFMKYLIKDCDHIGKLLALCGVRVVDQRPL